MCISSEGKLKRQCSFKLGEWGILFYTQLVSEVVLEVTRWSCK